MLQSARETVAGTEALLITAGAGMGVDSGLPDFRGSEGFWKAYPPYRHLGFNFMEMANPTRFEEDPALGWGFYGHRLHLYHETKPHEGFRLLREFAAGLSGGCFIFTSNVDGHFEVAGFDPMQMVECHGSIRHLQCFRDCRGQIWSAQDTEIQIDPETMRAFEPLPACPDCGGLARPNVLMFGDYGWNAERTLAQERRYQEWLHGIVNRRLTILEFGAGTAIPTVRMHSEQVAETFPNTTLIRVNPREPESPVECSIEIAGTALETIQAILPT